MKLFSKKKTTGSTDMHLRGYPADPNTNKCLLMAAEKDIRLNCELLDIEAGACESPEYRRLSPFGKAPCLKEGGYVVSGIQAILAYMDVRGEGGSLNPKKAAILGEQNYWVDVAERFIDPNVTVLTSRLKNNTESANENDVQSAKAVIGEAMDTLDTVLSDRRRFIAGDYSFADIHWTAAVHLCVLADHQDLISDRPNIKQWYDRVKGHTSKVSKKQTYSHLASLEEIREKRLKSVA
ncbi:MAG: glutathione S-transferase family protein [Candidatus Thiodiazotropha sp. (ex. Lucinisca nassula)]|nr:glutathione S-transferase family protein [Candidatus Thiodiazotropha sp. (ex. Lucinisca nassula)]MBW9274219.1 glutathione S-transferase family protein [Candidatus Thiodiazotropha sp. (ex. Lucinisca nassula)]